MDREDRENIELGNIACNDEESLNEYVTNKKEVKKNFYNKQMQYFKRMGDMQKDLATKSTQEHEDDFDSVVDFCNSLEFPLKVYRGLLWKDKNQVDLNNIGVHWTIDKDFIKRNGFKTVIVGEVNEDDVDWKLTQHTYVYYSVNKKYPENEIWLKKNAKPHNLEVYSMEEFLSMNESLKPVDLDEDDLVNADLIICDSPYQVNDFLSNEDFFKINYYPNKKFYVLIDPWNATHFDVNEALKDNGWIDNIDEDFERMAYAQFSEDIFDDLSEYSPKDFDNMSYVESDDGSILVCLDSPTLSDNELVKIFKQVSSRKGVLSDMLDESLKHMNEGLKEEYDRDIYYRGYDSRYGVFDSDNEYGQLYTWVTDEPEYALEYAENNEYGKVAKVRITCSDDEIGGVLDLPEDVDYYDPGDEEFQEYILDQGLKGYGFEAGDYDDYCICISKDCVEVIDPDVKYEPEEESLKEGLLDDLKSTLKDYKYDIRTQGWHDQYGDVIDNVDDDWEPNMWDWYYSYDTHIFSNDGARLECWIDEDDKVFTITVLWAINKSKGKATELIKKVLELVPQDWKIQINNDINNGYWAHIFSKYFPDRRYEDTYEALKEDLTKEQEEYFKNSKIRDEKGNLLVCYHGTETPGFTEFDARKGKSQFGDYKFDNYNINYFTTNKETAIGYTEIGVERDNNVYACYLNIVNPYVVNNKTEDDMYRTWQNIKDETIRNKEVDYFKRFYNKWSSRNISEKDLDELNKDLFYFNCKFVPSEDDETYYDLISLNDNTMFGRAHPLMYYYELSEYFDTYNYEEFRNSLVGDYEGEDKEYFRYTIDNLIKWVLLMNEEEGTNYDGIIVPEIYDIGPKGSPFMTGKTTDIVTLKSSNQIKKIDNLKPTSSNNINEAYDTITLYTIQDKSVLNKLQSGETYIASYSNIFEKEYEPQYRKLAELHRFNNCPIFCASKTSFHIIEDSGIEEDGNKVLLTLNVPKKEVRKHYYYDWTDYLYFEHGGWEDSSMTKEEIENLIKKQDTPNRVDTEYVLDRIEPEWLVEEDYKENLNESKQDIEKFRQWAGDELADRFFKLKDRLPDRTKDIYYWMSMEKQLLNLKDRYKNAQEHSNISNYEKWAHESVIDSLRTALDNVEQTPTRREINKLGKAGSEKIYEDDNWLVLKINTYEASVKYGKGTEWCITGNNSDQGRDDFNHHTLDSGATIYFFINKKNKLHKYALEYINDTDWCLFDETDFPQVGYGNSFKRGVDSMGGEHWYKGDSRDIFPIIKDIKKYFNHRVESLNEDIDDKIQRWQLGNETFDSIFDKDDVEKMGPRVLGVFSPKGDKLFDLDVYDADDIVRAINQAYVRGSFLGEDLLEKIVKMDESVSNIYYRFTTKDAFGDNMGGLFSSVWKYIYSAEDYDEEDNELEDIIDDLMSAHEVPSEWLGEKVKFAFSKEFVDKHIKEFSRVEELLKEGDWSLIKTEVDKNKVNVVYEDENQIAYTLKESLNESKADFEKFKAWAGEELYNNFMQYKNRLKNIKLYDGTKADDIYAWMKRDNKDMLAELIIELQTSLTKKEREKEAREGAQLVYKDDTWQVYKISTYEASLKYGKNTSWCISGKEDGFEYFSDYNNDDIYFFIGKGRKYALIMTKGLGENAGFSDRTIYNDDDEIVHYIPNAPKVEGVPDVSRLPQELLNKMAKLLRINVGQILDVKSASDDPELFELFYDYDSHENLVVETNDKNYYVIGNWGDYEDVTDEIEEFIGEYM